MQLRGEIRLQREETWNHKPVTGMGRRPGELLGGAWEGMGSVTNPWTLPVIRGRGRWRVWTVSREVRERPGELEELREWDSESQGDFQEEGAIS